MRLNVGDKVRFEEDKQPYRVRAVSSDGRWAICTRPFNLQRTVQYTIIDFEVERRRPDDLIFCMGYETEDDIASNMARLEAGDIEVSPRRALPLRIAEVRAAVSCRPSMTPPADQSTLQA